MKTIQFQGKPTEGDHWHQIPEAFVKNLRAQGYQVRELVLRDEAEQAIRDAQSERAAA